MFRSELSTWKPIAMTSQPTVSTGVNEVCTHNPKKFQRFEYYYFNQVVQFVQ